ncbi:MAG: ImmA/IrrE family metallo-endopeptidase [Hyphomicrobiales bacterium]|nr:ImmA/IrrE family metallo-endopeptidase [Hyphomicrobiales bacterium]MCY4049084.1 ImmA/IrrE family metallo-endopeptidase [Hyphomicrobiales bacterium]MCY4053257.1 ImmA/IrrE family metallo-endopeptidase [Hyphomicrobiales bacterium]
MKPKEWNRLSQEHREILEKYLSEYPVKVGQIAKELNVKIKVSGMPTGISGQIKNEESGYIIRVNRYEARERQRFTIAHELAHFMLHKKLIDISAEGITDNVLYRSGAPENTEYEANRLAAEIVMPTSQIEETLRENFNKTVTEETIENLAERFQVSKAAMEIRLSNFS